MHVEGTSDLDQLNICVSGLSAVRRDPKRDTEFVLALESFTGRPRDRIGLVGRSGSGKSTILEALGLLLWLDQLKTFELAGSDLTSLFVRRDLDALARYRASNIGFVPQDAGLLPYLTVRENAELAVKLAGLPKMPYRKLQALADEIGIVGLLGRLPASLSGGEKQRAAVLRAMVTEARVILADEPTASLDDETSNDVMGSLTRLSATFGVTLICASHDVDLLTRFDFDVFRIHHAKQDNRTIAVLRRARALS